MTSRRTRDRLVARLRREGISNERVLEAIREVPRHLFVDEALASRAYEDTALPIGSGQTISQPYIVARMSEALLEGGQVSTVLEIGSGCGYQTAILALLVERVFSIERIAALLAATRERIYALGLHNVRMKHADGAHGWPEHAPFDAIMVTAACGYVPPALLDELAPGGRLVVPVGEPGVQRLICITRATGGFEQRELERVSFVPLVGGTG